MQAIRSISTTPRHFILELLTSRRKLINAVLVTWLAILAVSIAGDLIALSAVGERAPFGRNALLLLAVLIALRQNLLGRPGVAMLYVTGTIFTVITITAFDTGLQGPLTVLDRYYIPTVLAGLMLNRRALLGTAAATVIVSLGLLGMQLVGLLPDSEAIASPGAVRTTLQFLPIYVTLVVVLDQFGTVVRDNLARAAERDGRLHAALEAQVYVERELDDERRLNAAIASNIPGLLFVVDEVGNVIRSGERTNAAREPQPGNPGKLHDLLHPLPEGELQELIDETLNSGTATRLLQLHDDAGASLTYTMQSTRLELAKRTLVIGVGLDTSELNVAKQQIESLNTRLRARVQRLTALHQIDKAIIASLDLHVMLDIIITEITRELAVDAASILLHRPARGVLQWGADKGFTSAVSLQDLSLPLGTGVAGKVGLERQQVFLRSEQEIIRHFEDRAPLSLDGYQSYVAVPLVAKGQLQGVLELFHREVLDPDADWFEYLNALATQTAIALDNASLFEGMERANSELLQAYDTTIEGWSRALDLRDHETEGHSQRVTDLTLRLARRLGVGDDDLVHMRRGALLHDIGKMGVPDRILLKSDGLTPEEQERMQEHPNLALDLLSPISFLQPALDIPYSHHEKWDGSGYPQGLAGELIPRAARIFALADVYDALTSDRPYRKAWTAERALELIASEAGRHFDPVITEEFLAMLRAGPQTDG